MSQFPEIQELLEANKKWAEGVNTKEPGFFASLKDGQVSSTFLRLRV